MNYNQFFNQLAVTSSRNDKIALLNEYKHDIMLKRIVTAALDPLTNYYIRKIPEYTRGNKTISLADALQIITNEFATRKITGNTAIDKLQHILTYLSTDDALVIERIIKKDLKCGVSDSTANKVWPGLIMSYPVMLCEPYNDKLISKIRWPAIAQIKQDGMRFNAVVKDNKCSLHSRNGKRIDLLGRLEQEFIQLASGRNCVFDGELLIKLDDSVLERKTGNGIINKGIKGTISAEEAATVQAVVWDVIEFDNWATGRCNTKYNDRFDQLQDMLQANSNNKIELVQYWLVQDLADAQSIYDRVAAEGFEGIILKDLNGPWEDKRAKHQIKFKAELECDLVVVGTEISSEGKFAGKVGAILCESADGIIKVGVGSGFTEEEREGIYPKGTIVTVKYNARITDSRTGQESLFLPIFIEKRMDKSKPDHSSKIE